MRGYLTWVAPKCAACLGGQEQMIPRKAQSPTHWGFVAPDEPYDCAQCITRHGTEYGFEALPEAAAPAWNLYLELQDQQRIGMDVIGLDIGILPFAFRMHGIPEAEQPAMYRMIRAINAAVQGHRAHERESKAQRDKLMKQQGF